MPILGIDTATLVSGVALATPDKLLAELTLQTKKTHSELLLPHIEQIIAMAGVTKQELTAIAVSLGPGSFTGLRIGLGTAKALAYALNIPLVGVPTLAALAYSCPVPGCILAPMLDAQKGNVYQALYRWKNDALEEMEPAKVLPFAEALSGLAALEQPVLILGEGAVMHREAIVASNSQVAAAKMHVVMPRAASVAALGHQLLADGARHDAMLLEPLYIRRSEAEVLWEQRHGGSKA